MPRIKSKIFEIVKTNVKFHEKASKRFGTLLTVQVLSSVFALFQGRSSRRKLALVSHVVLVLVAVVSADVVPVLFVVAVLGGVGVDAVVADGQNVKILPRLIDGLVNLANLSS